MKIPLLILCAITVVACKKNRECSCTVTSNNTTTSVPIKGGNSVQSTETSTYTAFARYENERAKQFRQSGACQNRIVTSSHTYTNPVQMQGSVDMYLVTSTSVEDFNCEIK